MKKNFSLLAFSFLLLLFAPSIANAKIYLSENFNSVDERTIPKGWDNSEMTGINSTIPSMTSHWAVKNDGSGYDGNYIYYDCNVNGINNTNALKTPWFKLENEASLSFMFKNPKGGDFSVFVEDRSSSDYTGNVLFSELTNVSDWDKRTINLNQYLGKEIRIVFRGISNSILMPTIAGIYLDNVDVRDIPTCAAPIGFMLNDVKQTEVTIGWGLSMDGGDMTARKFQVKLTETATGNVILDNVDINAPYLNYTFTNLTPKTKYTLVLRTNCEDLYKGYSDWSEPLEFSTLSSPVNIPIVQNFDALGTSLPDGWFTGGNVTIQGNIKDNQTGKSIKFTTTSSGAAYFITPQIAHPGNDLFIKATLYGSAGTEYSVGIMTNPYNIETFIPIHSDMLSANNKWIELRCGTENGILDATENQAIAIYVPAGKETDFYVDNFEITAMPPCSKPENLKIDYTTYNSVQFSWDQLGMPEEYIVTLKKGANTTTHTITTNPAIINGLSASTDYSISIKAKCDGNEETDFTSEVSFSTGCTPVSDPIFKNEFSNASALDCWSVTKTDGIGSGQNTAWTIDSDGFLAKKKGKAGSRSLLISRPLTIDEANKYEVRFKIYRENKAGAQNEGVRLWFNTRPDTINAVKTDFIHNTTSFSPFIPNGITDWYSVENIIPISGEVYIILEGVSQYKNKIQIDDLQLRIAPDCKKPAIPKVGQIDHTNNSIKVTWGTNGAGPQTKWIFNYTLTNVTDPENPIVKTETITVDKPEYTFTGLSEATVYKLKGNVKATCGDNETTETVSFAETEFITLCMQASPLPYNQQFTDMVFPPFCWQQYQVIGSLGEINTSGKSWKKDDKKGQDDYSSAQLETQPGLHGMLVSPKFNFEAGKTYRVSYWQERVISANSTKDAVNVWVNSTPDTVGATRIKKIPLKSNVTPIAYKNDEFNYYSADIPAEHSGMQYIIFEGIYDQGGNEGGVRIDNITVELKPTCDNIIDAYVIDTTSSTVTVVCADQSVTQWQVEYGEAGFKRGEGQFAIFNTPKGIVEGLNDNTNYDFYVRRYCSESDQGVWFGKTLRAKTHCAAFDVTEETPFFEGFEFEDYPYDYVFDAIDSSCNKVVALNADGKLRVTESEFGKVPLLPYEGKRYAFSIYSDDIYMFRKLYLRAGVTYEISGAFMQSKPYDGTFYDELSKKYSASSTLTMAILTQMNPGEINAANTAAGDICIGQTGDLSIATNFVNEWNVERGTFTVQEDGEYYACWHVLAGGTSEYTGWDNLKVRVISCIEPGAGKVSDVKVDAAKINSQAKGDKTEIVVTTEEFEIDEEIDPSIIVKQFVQDTQNGKLATFDITGLSEGTTYYYSLRTVCADENSLWIPVAKFSTRCPATAIPFTDSFNGDIRCYTTSKGDVQIVNTESQDGGSKSLEMKNGIVVLPEIEFAEGKNLANYMLSGWIKSETRDKSTKTTNIVFGVTTDPNNVADYFEQADEIAVSAVGEWVKFNIYFDVFTTHEDYADALNATFIAIFAESAEQIYIDNISIVERPTCGAAIIAEAKDIDWESAKIAIDATPGTSKWKVTLDNGTVFESDTPVVQLTGLTESTTYRATVTSICDGSDGQAYQVNSFTTACRPLSVPYIENFDNVSKDQIPSCWLITPNDGKGKTRWGGYGVTTRPALWVDNKNNNPGTMQYLYTPVFDLSDDWGALLHVKIQNGTGAGPLQIWACDRFGNELGLVNEKNTTFSGVPTNYTFDVTEFAGQYLRFKFVSTTQSKGGSCPFIDRVEIEPLTSCARPKEIKLLDRTVNSISLEVVDTTATNSKWQYIIVEHGADWENETPTDISQKTFTISNLKPYTSYDIYVRAVCATDDMSDYREFLNAHTACDSYMKLPYNDSFENYHSFDDACFEIYTNADSDPLNEKSLPRAEMQIKNQDDATVGVIKKCYVSEGEVSMLLTSSHLYDIYFILPEFEAVTSRLQMSFKYRTDLCGEKYENQPIVGIITDMGNPDETFHGIDTLDFTYESCGNAVNSMTSHSTDFTNIASEYGNGRIAFMWPRAKHDPSIQEDPTMNTQYQAQGYRFAIDEVSVTKVDCPALTAEVQRTTNKSVDLKFSYNNELAEVKYGEAGTSVDDCKGNKIVKLSDDDVTIGGLNPATAYDMYVRALCIERGKDTIYANWSAPISFSTDCDDIEITNNVPYIENFDNYANGVFPPCYKRIVEYGNYPVLTTEAFVTGTHSLQLNGENFVALPTFDKPIAELTLSFSTIGKTGSIEVGVQSDINDTATFTPVYSSMVNVTKQRHTVQLSEFDIDNATSIILHTYNTNDNVCIDSVVVEWAGTCYEPRKLEMTNISTNSATATWRRAPGVEKYEYTLNGSAPTIVTEKENKLQLSNLTAGTHYTLSIRNYCGDNTTAATTVEFVTLQSPAELPYDNGFENDTENANWTLLNGNYSNGFVFGTATDAINDGTKALYISNADNYSYVGEPATVYAYRSFLFEAGKEYTVTFDWKGNGSATDYARLFLTTAEDDLANQNGNILMSNSAMANAIDNGVLSGSSVWANRTSTFSVAEDGIYNVTLGWTNAGTAVNPPVAIDKLVIYENCAAIESVNIIKAFDKEVKFEIVNNNTGADNVWKITKENDATSEALAEGTSKARGRSQISAPVSLGTSESAYLHVKSACNTYAGESDWVTVQFTTGACASEDIGKLWIESFENYTNEDLGCWISTVESNEEFGSGYNWRIASIAANDTMNGKDPNTGDKCIYINHNTKVKLERNLYINAGSYTVSIYAKENTAKTSKINLYIVENGVETSILSNNIRSNEYDVYEGVLSVATDGVYTIGIRGINIDPKDHMSMTDNFVVDDLTIEKLGANVPGAAIASNITSTSADLDFALAENAEEYEIQVLNSNGTTIFEQKVTTNATLTVTSLTAGSIYTSRIRGIDADGNASIWIEHHFYTICGLIEPPYSEQFTLIDNDAIPNCWNVAASDGSNPENTRGWQIANDAKYGKIAKVDWEGMSGSNKLRTPIMHIPAGTSNYIVEFDVLSQVQNFNIKVSIDGGTTYNQTLKALSYTKEWEHIKSDLAKYAGKDISFEFNASRGPLDNSSILYAAIDNFEIYCLDADEIIIDTVCAGMPYNKYGFEIPASELQEGGDRKFEQRIAPEIGETCHHNRILRLNVHEKDEIHIYDTIRQGQSYEFMGVEFYNSGTYKDTKTSRFGCDSITVLHLHVMEVIVRIDTTICEGEYVFFDGENRYEEGSYKQVERVNDSYDSTTVLNLTVLPKYFEESIRICSVEAPYYWQGEGYENSGRYEKTYKNRLGCDSIMILNLTVVPTEQTIDTSICRGGEYILGNEIYTEAGNYEYKTQSSLGCDSIIYLKLRITEPDTTIYEEFHCEGDRYVGNGIDDILYSDTVAIKILTSSTGCDSVIRYNINVRPISEVYVDSTIKEGESIVFGGNTISTPGTYTTTDPDQYGCDSITHLNLTIGTGVDNIEAKPMAIAPNPIRIGEVAYIDIDENVEDVNIMVYNSIGELVQFENSPEYPLAIRNINTAGVYYVKVITNSGKVYVGKLIVR